MQNLNYGMVATGTANGSGGAGGNIAGNTSGSSGSSGTAGSGNNNNLSIIPNQNGLVQQMNAALLAERYLLMDLVDGSTLYKCMDVKTHEELVCKVRIVFNYSGDFHLA